MSVLDPKIKTELSNPQHTKLHTGLLTQALAWVDYSRSVMSSYYEEWDANYDQYDATNPVRRKDERSEEEERPSSQSIPLTFAQVQTWKAFASQLLGQKQKYFEFSPQGKEDEKWRDLAEDVLQADQALNKWNVKRGQFLANIAIANVGVLKTGWHERKISIMTDTSEGGTTAFGQTWGAVKEKVPQSVTVSKGNKVEVLSPYRFFPDPSVSLTEATEGRFIASEHEFTRNELVAMEAQGQVAGVKYIDKNFTIERWDKRRETSRLSAYKHQDDKNDIVVVTEVQMKIVPSTFTLDDGTPLGPGKSEMILCLWIANDQRVIKADIMNYLHGEFTYDVAVFDTERHKYMRKSIVQISQELQTTADWFLNTRMESVTRNVESQLIVDPIAVDVSSVTSRSRIITLRKGAARAGIDRYIKQLQTSDPTVNHMSDIQEVIRLNHITTGINDNMLGQYNTGRRSATESRVVAGGASSRAVVILEEIVTQALSPYANKCLKNLRQGLTKDDIVQMVGKREDDVIKGFLADPLDIARNNDMFAFDGTSPSEKSFLAQSLQELLGIVLSNPQTAIDMDISPKLILEKIYELRGLNFKDDLGLDNDPQTMQKFIMEKAQQIAVEYLQSQGLLQQNGQGNQNTAPQGA